MTHTGEAMSERRGDEALPIPTSRRCNGNHAGYVDLRLDTRARHIETVNDSGEIHDYTEPMCGVP